MESLDDRGHDAQNLSLAGIRDVPVIVHKDRLKKRWDDICADHLQIVCFFDICVDKLQDLSLDCPKSSNFRSLGRDISCEICQLSLENFPCRLQNGDNDEGDAKRDY